MARPCRHRITTMAAKLCQKREISLQKGIRRLHRLKIHPPSRLMRRRDETDLSDCHSHQLSGIFSCCDPNHLRGATHGPGLFTGQRRQFHVDREFASDRRKGDRRQPAQQKSRAAKVLRHQNIGGRSRHRKHFGASDTADQLKVEAFASSSVHFNVLNLNLAVGIAGRNAVNGLYPNAIQS
jgi:hypothetical protein